MKLSAKYIEGLENRLGRMEALLKLSGLLGGEDDDRTDLGTLEKRLADKTCSQSNAGTPRSSISGSQPRALESPHNTPQIDKLPTPRGSIASPDHPSKEKEGEPVEELSDMMCSLVTNNCGESRYIGTVHNLVTGRILLTYLRILIGFFYLLTQRHTVGK